MPSVLFAVCFQMIAIWKLTDDVQFVEENNPKEVINEAIAVANFAMMLYDNISKRESKKEAIF